MVYRCLSSAADQLTCNFEQASVRLKAKWAEFPQVIETARKQFREEKPPTKQDCSMSREMIAVVNGTKPASKPEIFDGMTAVEKSDLKQAAVSFANYCDKPTEENYLNVVKVDHEKKRRTCLISVNTFQQSFKLLSNAANQPAWVVQSQPEGSCGVVQLSRFEPEEITIGKSKFTNWKYIARKAISNPTGEFFPGAKCSGLDESIYVYDWRSKEHQRTCDYIEFSPI